MLQLEEFLNLLPVFEIRELAKIYGAKNSTSNTKKINIILIAKNIFNRCFVDKKKLTQKQRVIFEKYEIFFRLYNSENIFKERRKPKTFEEIIEQVINRN